VARGPCTEPVPSLSQLEGATVENKVPEKAVGIPHELVANESFIFVLDHGGYVWSRPATEVEAEWKCLGRPPTELYYESLRK
jgi:hypothetical protein